MKIISGGQSGVDRAALDVAIELGLAYGGWCPQGGWAEDFPDPPGLLTHYPALTETPERAPKQRTRWNVRDSDAVLIVTAGAAASSGTRLAIDTATGLARPVLEVEAGDPAAAAAIRAWLADIRPERLGIGGPRESEAPGIYRQARSLLRQALQPD